MNKKRICFLVGSMAISGGTYVIVQHAAYLHDQGFEVTLAVQEPFTAQTLAWHDRTSRLRCVPIDAARGEMFDLVIATWWKTALELRYFNSPRYAYFVQSIESRFYPASEVPLRALVDATYRLPGAYVTEATWIRDHLKTNYGHEVALVRNGIRKDVYRTTGPVIAPRDRNRTPRVLVEGHFGVSFKNTALGIRLAREAGAKDIWLLTGTPVKWVPGVSRVFSRVPMNVTPEIYRSCDILVKLSTVEGMFGPPLEIFHCGGTAIVFDVTGHDEYIVDGQNACVVRRGDMDGVVMTLHHLLNDRTELARLQAGALKTAEAWASWDESSEAFRDWVESVLAGPTADREALAELCDKAFSDYVRDEQVSLANASRMPRHRLSTLAARLPPSLLRSLKQLEAAGEVLFGPREVR
ncbi:glycosyltransferase [Laribacter hongkongensis]|uniref:glycosyltransferase n=1 Tax=Laribacter hongkongensis TaxID=168471 RepID=UPI001EFEA4BA|nr:glycosyltransferase [Laribacter hongkongensis]MCG9032997.1 glycosyltransferase [Laribacter hongkongensis]MCG9093083.1 glycosyltransferase [Laribacter hongkongensis]